MRHRCNDVVDVLSLAVSKDEHYHRNRLSVDLLLRLVLECVFKGGTEFGAAIIGLHGVYMYRGLVNPRLTIHLRSWPERCVARAERDNILRRNIVRPWCVLVINKMTTYERGNNWRVRKRGKHDFEGASDLGNPRAIHGAAAINEE